METIKVDAVVVGAGAGGFGAVYRLLKNKNKVAVVDLNSDFGGTAVFSGVNCWEPGISSSGVSSLLAKKLLKNREDAWVCKFVPNFNIYNLNKNEEYDFDWQKHSLEKLPFVVSTGFKKEKYSLTERRCYVTGDGGRFYRRFTFNPIKMSMAMNDVLRPYTKNFTRFFNAKYIALEKDGDKISSITIKQGEKHYKILANYFIDGTGDVALSRDFGVKTALGAEQFSVYSEPSANKDGLFVVNGVSLLFVIKKVNDKNFIADIPEEYKSIDISYWKENFLYKDKVLGFFNIYPDLTININMLPTMDGQEYLALKDDAKKVLLARVYAYFNYLQTKKGLKGYEIVKIFNKVGIRESYRIVGDYVLTEKDVRKGFLLQEKRNEFIAYSDHALDVHGDKALGTELDFPFGIPLSCTKTSECKNLFVASKGISLSHIACSSARLTRTIMAIGEGVGEAVSLLLLDKRISYKKLRRRLKLNRYERFLLRKKTCCIKNK